MLIDKRHPHAEREVMLMSSGTRLRPGLHEHSPRFIAALGALAVCFAEHAYGQGLYPVISWSYDPATIDRESIQGEKRFHAHLVGRLPAELAHVNGCTIPARTYPPRQRRRAVDEASILGALLAADCLQGVRLHTLEVVEPLPTPQATASLQVRVPGGWEAFAAPGLFADLATIHAVLRGIYDAVADACLIGPAGKWQRPLLQAGGADRVRLPLGPRSRTALAHYLMALQPELITEAALLAQPSSRARTTHIYPLADLAYSVCFSEHHGELYGHVRVNVFSDLGGAGMSVINGTIVKIRKGVGAYNEHEIAARQDFQRGYLTALRRHPVLGGTALYPLLESA